jgi:hypothetical protein
VGKEGRREKEGERERKEMGKQGEEKRRKCKDGEMGKYCNVRWEREEARETGEEEESIA